MDDQTRQYIEAEVTRQLSSAVNRMRVMLREKHEAAFRKSWWRRAFAWVGLRVHALVLEYRRQQWERLSEAERGAHEDRWLTTTLPKLRGTPPSPRARLEPGDEDRAQVLETDFVKNILGTTSKETH